MSRPIIVDCSGPVLTAEEAALFRELDPYGFILFARNVETPEQVRALIGQIWEAVGRPVPVLIDQEGGRVARLTPPHWRKAPPAWTFATLAETDIERARRAAWLNSRLFATELSSLGITVDCLPVLDLRFPDAHAIIGDRAYGATAELVATLGRAAAEGLMAGGVLPVIKHIPGHGRAHADSHLDLPRVTAPRAELAATDFVPFAMLKDMPLAMTAHIVYTAIDPDLPATLSPTVIDSVIRREIGFRGVLMSDDITMKALTGPLVDRAIHALNAGCDLVLLCNASLEDRRAVLEAVPELPKSVQPAIDRYFITKPAKGVDMRELLAELDDLTEGAVA